MSHHFAAIPTTDREPEDREPSTDRRAFPVSNGEIADMFGVTPAAVDAVARVAMWKLRRAAALWESVGWDETRKPEIASRLEDIALATKHSMEKIDDEHEGRIAGKEAA